MAREHPRLLAAKSRRESGRVEEWHARRRKFPVRALDGPAILQPVAV